MTKAKHIKDMIRNFGPSFTIIQLVVTFFSHTKSGRIPRWLINKRNTYVFKLIDSLVNEAPILPSPTSTPHTNHHPAPIPPHRIWVMWYQGEKEAPEIIKHCISSIRKHSDAILTVLDKSNIHHYIGEYPTHIAKGVADGYIPMAALSDYTRTAILARYGGLWLDATILCTDKVPSIAFEIPVYTYRQKGYANTTIGGAWWKSFVLGASGPSDFFTYVNTILNRYWKRYDKWGEYFLFDLILSYCFSMPKFSNFKKNIPIEDKDIYWLQKNKDRSWIDSDLHNLCFINKLNYKNIPEINSNSVLNYIIKEYT